MSKKIVLAIFGIFVILVAGGGFFWWWHGREITGSPEDYVILDRTDGTFVENKKAGLSVKVPEGWKAERVKREEGWVMLYSPETKIEWKEEGVVLLPLEKGCIIDSEVLYKKMTLGEVELDIKYTLTALGLDFIEVEDTFVNSTPALRTTFDTKKIGPGGIVNIPHNDKVYIFNLTFGVNEKEECTREFDNFLETVSIE